ncbi:MAG: DUF6702 family protein [Planctomycetaceae bacterium]|jgi:hypothetical protein
MKPGCFDSGQRRGLSAWLCLGLLLAQTCAAVAGGQASAHPFHATAAEVEWNGETACFEVALQLPGLVMEEELSAIHQRRVNLETTTDAEQLLQRYIADRFQLSGRSFSGCRLKWVGMEVEVKNVWAYFELQPEFVGSASKTALPGADLKARCELLISREGQVNLISVATGKARGTAHLTPQQTSAAIQFEAGQAAPLLKF